MIQEKYYRFCVKLELASIHAFPFPSGFFPKQLFHCKVIQIIIERSHGLNFL